MPDNPPTLLLCFDGSDQARHAVEVIGRLSTGGRVYVLNVWEPFSHLLAHYPWLGTAPLTVDPEEVDEKGRQESLGIAHDGAQLAAAAGLLAEERSAPMQQTLWETILAVGEELDVDVIVTGTRGLRGVQEVVARSLSHVLIQHSHRPVLAIPQG